MPKLNASKDFINWRRILKAYTQPTDTDFTKLQEASEKILTRWNQKLLESNMKAKSTIAVIFASGILVQESATVENNIKSAKKL